MKTPKKFLHLLSMVSLFLSTQAFALTIPEAGTYVTMANDWYVPYTMIAADGTSYQTFCLEHNNYFSPGSTYYVESVGDIAFGGGVGAVGDPVDDRTEKLYAAYFSNIFAGSSLFPTATLAENVQKAIWYLEGETGGSKSAWDNFRVYTPFKNFVVTSGWNIVAVNLSTGPNSTTDIQSQLVGVYSVPEPSLMLLLGTGTVGLVGISRRRKK